MAEPAKSHVPRWIIIGTAVLGLVAGVLLVVSRVYEVQKARAEAARARLDADSRERELKGRPAPPPDPAPAPVARPVPDKVTPKPAAVAPKVNPPLPKPPTDLDRLQGTWECTFEQIGGKDFTAADLAAANKTMTVAGETMTISRFQKGAVGEYRGTVVLRTDGGRNLFDLTGTGQGGGRLELLGVYAFEGAEFKLCYRIRAADNPLRERAEGFSTAAGGPVVYVRFRRAGGAFPPGMYEGVHVHVSGARATVAVDIRADGTYRRVTNGKNLTEGRYEVRDGRLLLRGATGMGFVEEWTPDGDRVLVKLWYPMNLYPDFDPIETGELRRRVR